MSHRRRRVLITAFGPFPGAPANPTPEILARIVSGRLRRAPVKLLPAVFATSYAAIAKLDGVVERFEPDLIVHLGLAGRADRVRVETRAINRAAPYRADSVGVAPARAMIDPHRPLRLGVRAPVRAIAARLVAAGVPARLSHHAGDYLCNALLWRGLAVAGKKPCLFLHVPQIARYRVPRPVRVDGRRRAVFHAPHLAAAVTAAIEDLLARG